MISENLTFNDSSVALNDLYPALFQCFAIITCGYLTGRAGIVTEHQHGALNTFVGTFSLPSFIFIKLASLQLSQVNWIFLLSVFLSKAVVFISICIITLLVSTPMDPTRAGLYAIFCTQSNDFAIGYPIISVLYSKVHKDFINYLYLAAPINLVMLNPFGFILMELGKNRSISSQCGTNAYQESRPAGWLKVVKTITWNIMKNPIFFMTGLGLCGNLVFNGEVPLILSTLLNVFAEAFSSTALFLLGLRMVGKVQKLRGTPLLVVGMLISAKLLVLPVVTREVTSVMMHYYGSNNTTEITDFSTFGFLYGTIPAAPATFVYALTYNVNADLVASAMVACTFLSAPLMFASARMVLASTLEIEKAISILQTFNLDISIIGILLCIWTIVVFIMNKTYRRITHRIIFFMLFSQILSCSSVLFNMLPGLVSKYLKFFLSEVGDLSILLWASVLATSLVFIYCQNLKMLADLEPVFLLICFGIPIFCVSMLIILVPSNDSASKDIEQFLYGPFEATIDLTILIASFIVMIGCLIYHRFNMNKKRDGSSETSALCINRENISRFNSIQSDLSEPEINSYIDNRLKTNTNVSNEALNQSNDDPTCELNEQYLSHIVVVLFFQVCSVFISLSVCVWRILTDSVTGVYIELLFISLSISRGIILLIFILFGLDTPAIVNYISRRIKRILKRGQRVTDLFCWDELPPETKLVCEKFCTDNIQQCHRTIAMNYWWVCKDYRQCFTGQQLVSWLLDNNLVQDRFEGVEYGNKLLSGRIIKQLNNAQLFCDDSALLYCFNQVEGLLLNN